MFFCSIAFQTAIRHISTLSSNPSPSITNKETTDSIIFSASFSSSREGMSASVLLVVLLLLVYQPGSYPSKCKWLIWQGIERFDTCHRWGEFYKRMVSVLVQSGGAR